VKAHYNDPFWGIFGSNIIVHTIYLIQKYGTFNFGNWFWCLSLIIFIFTKLMLCNIILITINFIIYIEGSMSIYIMYINITWPLSRFDCTRFKVSLLIKLIDFNEFFKKFHPNMFCHLPCECDYLSNFQFTTHLSHICLKKHIFWNENFQISHMVSKHGSNYVKW